MFDKKKIWNWNCIGKYFFFCNIENLQLEIWFSNGKWQAAVRPKGKGNLAEFNIRSKTEEQTKKEAIRAYHKWLDKIMKENK